MLFFNGWDSNQRLFTTVTMILFPTSTAGHKDSPGRRYTTDIQAEGDQHGWQQQQHNNTATQQHNNTAAQNMWCSICIFIICVPDYFFVRGREISICGGQIRQTRSRILPQQKHLHSNFFYRQEKIWTRSENTDGHWDVATRKSLLDYQSVLGEPGAKQHRGRFEQLKDAFNDPKVANFVPPAF